MPEIRKASTILGSVMSRFYGDAFPERAAFLSEHWRWLYRLGRFPGIEPLVLVDEERVVGHAGVIPLTLARLGREAPAMWFVDFALLPGYQGKGHGKALTEAWMAMCPDRVTFCNERSIQVFRKFGWKERLDARVLTQPLELSVPLARFGALGSAAGKVLNPAWRAWLRARSRGAPALETAPLPLDAGGLAERFAEPAGGGTRVVRDAEWFKWRLLENPRRDEHLLASAGGVDAVFRLFESRGRRRAHLLHVGPGPEAARAVLVKAFARWALEQDADDAWTAASEPALLAACSPFFSRRHPLRFAWHSDDAAVSEALAGPLSTQGIDSDHDLMFP
ncbi:MAG: GNAT family N-acetyltransferase [Elusimicrobia bacterium]|nr:GNAT family N-acetyltransferase [Elusimicrobiota bacterium]